MHMHLLNSLPSPKIAIPLAITGAAVVTNDSNKLYNRRSLCKLI